MEVPNPLTPQGIRLWHWGAGYLACVEGENNPGDLRCIFCGLSKQSGVAGETREIFACYECIALMVNIRRTELGNDSWPPPE